MADKEELKAKILELCQTSSKPQLYLKDMQKKIADAKPREIKNAANELVREGKLKYWSSGSSTMYAATDRVQDEEKE